MRLCISLFLVIRLPNNGLLGVSGKSLLTPVISVNAIPIKLGLIRINKLADMSGKPQTVVYSSSDLPSKHTLFSNLHSPNCRFANHVNKRNRARHSHPLLSGNAAV